MNGERCDARGWALHSVGGVVVSCRKAQEQDVLLLCCTLLWSTLLHSRNVVMLCLISHQKSNATLCCTLFFRRGGDPAGAV